MAMEKKFLISENELIYLADVIREVTGTTDKLIFPEGFINAINTIVV